MATYVVWLTTPASTSVTVETEETDPEKIAAVAVESVDVGALCHQCEDSVALGDDWQPVVRDGKPITTRIR